MPKLLGVRTRPSPKCHCQTRLTITRAVSGFVCRRDPAGQLAPAAPFADGRLSFAREEPRQAPRDDRPEPGVTAADVDRHVLDLGKQPARSSPFLHGHRQRRLGRQARLEAGRARAMSSARFLSISAGLGVFLSMRRQLRLDLRDLPELLFPGLDLSLGDERHPVHRVLGPLGAEVLEDVRAVEDAGEGVVVLLRDRVELVVVAAGTAEREAEERLAHGVDLVVDHVADDLLLVGVAAVPDAVGEERRGDQPGRVDLSSVRGSAAGRRRSDGR